jgi:hypothetical protein
VLRLRRRGSLPELRCVVRNPPVPLPFILPLSVARAPSSEQCGRRRAAPPRAPASPATLGPRRRAHRPRHVPRVLPMPSAWPPEPRSAAQRARRKAGHGAAAARPPSATTHRPGPPWTGGPRPSPRSTAPPVDRPTPARHVASPPGRPRRSLLFCKKVPLVL